MKFAIWILAILGTVSTVISPWYVTACFFLSLALIAHAQDDGTI